MVVYVRPGVALLVTLRLWVTTSRHFPSDSVRIMNRICGRLGGNFPLKCLLGGPIVSRTSPARSDWNDFTNEFLHTLADCGGIWQSGRIFVVV